MTNQAEQSAMQHVIDAFARTDHNGNYLIATNEARAGIVFVTVVLLQHGRLQMTALSAPLEESLFEYCKRNGLGAGADALTQLKSRLIKDLSPEFAHDLVEAATAIVRDTQLDATASVETARRAAADRLKPTSQAPVAGGLQPPSGGKKLGN